MAAVLTEGASARQARCADDGASGEAAGITRVTVQLLPPLIPTDVLTKVRFTVLGRRGTYALTPAMVTSTIENRLPTGRALLVSLGLGAPVPPSDLQCANVVYTTVLANHCTFARNGNVVTCGGPRPVGPCHTGDPDDLVICDVLDAAHAEADHFAVHGVYFTGDCKDLPAFVPSPGGTCFASGDALAFTIGTSHPFATQSCWWTSNTAPGQSHLVCGS